MESALARGEHGVFGGKALLGGVPLAVWLTWLSRTERKMPKWAWLIVGANLTLTVATQFPYHNGIGHFNRHIREHCPPELRGPANLM